MSGGFSCEVSSGWWLGFYYGNDYDLVVRFFKGGDGSLGQTLTKSILGLAFSSSGSLRAMRIGYEW